MAESQQSGCLGFFLKLLGIGPGAGSGRGKNDLPYRLRDNFLSAAELAFYRVLEQARRANLLDQQQGATVGRVVRPTTRRHQHLKYIPDLFMPPVL